MYSAKKIFRSLFLFIFLSAGLYSCTDEHGQAVIDTDDENLVKLSIYTPSGSVLKSTSADIDESAVSSIKVLVMKKEGEKYVFKYSVDGHHIEQDAQNSRITTFTALLKDSDDPLKLILIVNPNDAFAAGSIMANMSETEVKAELTDTFDPENIIGNIPAFGEIELDNLNTGNVNTLSTTMLRAVARVDVYNQIDIGFSEKFKIENVRVYRANNKMKLVPNDVAWASEEFMSVKSPSIANGSAFIDAYPKTVEGTADYVDRIYLPESEAVAADSDPATEATCLVVGGYYADDDFLTYYRVDFNSGVEGHPFGQVLRNYKYAFNIKQVTHRGTTDPDEAANGESTSIIAVMQVWNEATMEMFFSDNDNYLGISSREIIMEYFAGTDTTVYLQTTIPFNIQATDENGNPTGNIISKPGEKLDNGFYTLEIVKENSDGEDIYRLLLVTTGANKTDEYFTGFFDVTTDFWTFDVTVKQKTYNMSYAGKTINVLTITSLPGDLGSSDGIFTEGVSGNAMRNVLENPANFSNSGTVPVKGIIVHDFSNEMISSSNTAYMAILEKMLNHVEVVHLPKNCTPSAEAAKLIYDWLEAEYYRVLILGMDNDITNANVRKYYDDVDGDWQEAIPGAITDVGTPIYEVDDRLLPFFFDGPFGPVPMNEVSMGFVNGAMGYNIGYNWDTTLPILIATEGDDNDSKMTHGINIKHGIFYCGESEITSARGNAMSQSAANNGTVSSEFDILMANVWAWIIDRVVAGL